MKRRPKKPAAFSDQIRQAVRDSGISQSRISREAGIDKSILSRFLSGNHGLELATLDRLAAFLKLQVIAESSKVNGD